MMNGVKGSCCAHILCSGNFCFLELLNASLRPCGRCTVVKRAVSLPVCSNAPAVTALSAAQSLPVARALLMQTPFLTLLWFYPRKGLKYAKQMVSIATVGAREYATDVCFRMP